MEQIFNVYSIHLDLLNFLANFTPRLTAGLFFGLINLLVAFSPSKIVPLVTFALLLCTSLSVVAARVLIMAKYHAVFLLGVESI